MTLNEIEDDWPMVLSHREQVLERIKAQAIEGGKQLRFDRGALIDAFTTIRDYRTLATRFGVSTGAIHDALTRIVRFARRLEYQTQVSSFRGKCRFVVMTPVVTDIEADALSTLLKAKGYESTILDFD